MSTVLGRGQQQKQTTSNIANLGLVTQSTRNYLINNFKNTLLSDDYPNKEDFSQ